MTKYKALHPRDDTDRLYVSRKEGGRGLPRIQDSVDASTQRLEDYIKKLVGRLVTTTRNNTDNIDIKRIKITWKQKKWKEKQLFGHFRRQTSEISRKKTWSWLRKENVLRETESLLIAAQNITIRTMSKQE